MTATNHTITGAVIATLIPIPIVAIPLAFLAHFVLDALPHFGFDDHSDKNFIFILAGDFALAMAVLISIFLLQLPNWPLLIASGIVCASPDLMWLPRWITELKGKTPKPMGFVRKFHAKIQWAEVQDQFGVLSEVAWFVFMLLALGSLSI